MFYTKNILSVHNLYICNIIFWMNQNLSEEQRHKLQVRLYLKQKMERLHKRQLVKTQQNQSRENKHESFMQHKKSADAIRMKSAMRDVKNQLLEDLSNSLCRRLDIGDPRTIDSIRPLQIATKGADSDTVESTPSSVQFPDTSKMDSIPLHGKKKKKGLDSKQRWQVSPLIQLFKTKGPNTKEWLSYEECVSRNNNGYSSKAKSCMLNPISCIVHHVVNTCVQDLRMEEDLYPVRFENPTTVSAIIASHIMEHVGKESSLIHQNTFEKMICEPSASLVKSEGAMEAIYRSNRTDLDDKVGNAQLTTFL